MGAAKRQKHRGLQAGIRPGRRGTQPVQRWLIASAPTKDRNCDLKTARRRRISTRCSNAPVNHCRPEDEGPGIFAGAPPNVLNARMTTQTPLVGVIPNRLRGFCVAKVLIQLSILKQTQSPASSRAVLSREPVSDVCRCARDKRRFQWVQVPPANRLRRKQRSTMDGDELAESLRNACPRSCDSASAQR